jgi:3-hydroxyisobutyrate dehydrogenase
MSDVMPPLLPPAKIALIGLGNMGAPMALQLMKAGYQVSGFDISPDARQRFSSIGGVAASAVTEAVSGADAIITLLPDSKAVRQALDSLIHSVKAKCLIIDMSSSDPVETRKLGQELIGKGFGFMDAPVSGGVRRAVDGTLTIMVGGNSATIDRAVPVLEAMGKSIFRTGDLGSGHAMKALNNYVSAAGLLAAVEAIAIGKQFGLDPALMTDILNVSTGRNNTTEVKLKQFIISETYNAGFPLKLMAKDVGIANSLAHAIDVPAPLSDACSKLWMDAAQALGSSADHTAIGRHIAGIKSKKGDSK